MSSVKQFKHFLHFLSDGKHESCENDGLDSDKYKDASGKRRISMTDESNSNCWLQPLSALTSEWLPCRHFLKENRSPDQTVFDRVPALVKQNKQKSNQENKTRITSPGFVKDLQNAVEVRRAANLPVTDQVHNNHLQSLKPCYVISESHILNGCPLMKLRASTSRGDDVFAEACRQRLPMLRSDPDHRIKRWIELTDIYTGPDTNTKHKK